jgi:L-ribulokinase
MADWIPAILTGTDAPKSIKRCICAAGHKAMFNPEWGGYPGVEFFEKLNPGLAVVRQTLPDRAYNVSQAAGNLTDEWADRLGLPSGIPVAVGAFDAHLGAVGCGIAPGIMVKIMGTSGCDMVVSPLDQELPDIPGLCGIVPESIRPGCYGLEAGQSAVGDIYNWFVNYIQPGGPSKGSHEALTERAAAIKAGASGLLGLDWHNGNRTVLVDQRLTGMLVGMTLSTTPGEMYRALIESTAFGARVIMERFEEYGVEVKRIVNSGGIARKNPLVMQIHADVLGKELEVAGSSQTCALGAAIAGAVVAGRAAGGYEDFEGAIDNMTGVLDKSYTPDPQDCKVYNRLFRLYKQLHDIYGREEYEANLYHVMKDLLDISEKVRSNGNV